MATYTIHLPPAAGSANEAHERARFIREAPALLALLFPALWLLWHRLWYALTIYLLFAVALAIWARMASSLAPAALSGIPALFLFLEGRQMIRRRLESRGWRHAGVVEADSLEEAEMRYFVPLAGRGPRPGRPQVVPAAGGTAPAPAGDGPAIGIFAE